MLGDISGGRGPYVLFIEMQISTPTMGPVWRFLKKLKIELSYGPAIPLLDIYLKECTSAYNQDTFTPMFIAAL
jgi:hypothetical protein